jgi:hypothetical protein
MLLLMLLLLLLLLLPAGRELIEPPETCTRAREAGSRDDESVAALTAALKPAVGLSGRSGERSGGRSRG